MSREICEYDNYEYPIVDSSLPSENKQKAYETAMANMNAIVREILAGHEDKMAGAKPRPDE